MEFSEANVVSAIQQFYSTNDENLRHQLDEWLTAAQSSLEVWRFSWNLLRYQGSSNDVAVQYFAANCLYRKLTDGRMDEYLKQYGNVDSAEAADKFLRNFLLENCVATQAHMVKAKLASAMAAYVVYTTPDIWPDAFKDLVEMWKETQPMLLLDVFGSIPAESGSMTMPIDRKSSVRGVLRTMEALVAEISSVLLQQHQRNSDIVDAAVKCVGSWVDFCNDANEWVGIVGQCLQCAAEVGGPTLAAIAKFFCRFMENSELRQLENFVGQLFDFLAPLFVRAYSTKDDFDDVADMCVALMENQTGYMLKRMKEKESILILVEAALSLSGSPGFYPVNETNSGKLFTFWYNFYEDALAEQDSKTRETWMTAIEPIYTRLSDVLFAKLKYPQETTYAHWTAEDKEQFEKYRWDGGDVFACCYRVLAGTQLLNTIVTTRISEAVQKAISTNGEAWEESEVVLFGLESIADYVSSEHEGLKTFFECDLVKIPFKNSIIANTGLRMVSKYSHIIADEKRLLKPVLGDFVIKFLNEPSTVVEATLALERLAKSGDAALAKDQALCSAIFSAASACFQDSRFKRNDQLRALSSIGYVLATQPNELIIEHLNEFLAPRLQRLQSVVDGNTVPCTKEDLLMEFDVLTTLISAIGSGFGRHSEASNASAPNPVYLIVSQSFGLFQSLYAASAGDKDVANKIIDTLKRALTTLSDGAKELLPHFCQMLTLMFPPHANAISITKPLYLLFAGDKELDPTMVALFNNLAEKVIGFESEDAAEAFLGLCHQLVKKQWKFFSNSENGLSFDGPVNIACRAIGNRSSDSPTVRQASQFLCELLQHSDSPRVVEMVERYGAALLAACFDRLRVELLSSCVEFVADVVLTLMIFNQQHTTAWHIHQNLAPLTSNPFIAAMLKEIGNKRKFREYAKQYNISCKKEARNAGL